MDKNKNNKEEYLEHLEQNMKEGVLLYVDQKLVTPEDIVYPSIVKEGYTYMADYIVDETGKLIEMRFDLIKC